MPYYFQQRVAERYFTYHNICMSGNKIENNKLYSVLAPQITGAVLAKDTPPYTNTFILLSGGNPLYLSNKSGTNLKPIKWAIVPSTNKYPDLNVISLTGAIPVNPNSINNFSYPFSLVLKNYYVKYRYFMTHPASGARINQPNPNGRWIYSKKPAFTDYLPYVNYFNYDFKNSYINNNLLAGFGKDIDTHFYNIVVSDENKNVIFKRIPELSNTTNFLEISKIPRALSGTFLSTSSAINIPLYPFDYDLSFIQINSNTSFGERVKMSERNILVSDPLSANGRIYVYSINQYLTGKEVNPEKILTSNYNLSGFGAVIDFKEIKNRSAKSYKEILAVSTKTQSNSSIEIYSNNFVTRIGGQPLKNLLNYSVSGQRFRNVWSSEILNQENLNGNGYYGYDLALQVPDTTFNKNTNILYVSEPYNNQGKVYVYAQRTSKNTWHYLTTLSSASAMNYGYSLASSGPYVIISAPNTLINNVTGAFIDVYKFSTSDQNGVSLSSNNGTSLMIGPSSYGYYDLSKTDTFFIPSTSNLGKHIDYNENNLNYNLQDMRTFNFYGNHLSITADDKTEVYTRYFDKFEKNCEISGAIKTKIWQNATFQINNSAVNLNSANVL
jgi:hypothetical protein